MVIPEIAYTIILILAIVLLLALYIVGLIRSLRAGSTGRRAAVPALTLGFALCVYLVLNVREIGPADWAQILLLFGLVVVTGVYAMSASKQADASVKMAEEMREQTKTLRETVSMSIRPSVSVRVTKIEGGDRHLFEPPKELYCELQNTGKGPAGNVVVTCESQGEKVEYTRKEFPSLNVGDKQRFSIHTTTPLSDQEVRVAYVFLKAIYNDELGEIWSTTLQIDRDGKWKPGEITPPKRLFGAQND